MARENPAGEQPATWLFLSPPPDTSPLTSQTIERWKLFLSDEERNFLGRQRGKRYHEYLLSRALLRHALSLTLSAEVPPPYWRIRSGNRIRPTLEEPGTQGWHCSLSHSAGRVAIALSKQGPCGVDLELQRPRRNQDELADTYYTAGECTFLNSTPEPERQVAFYRLWTLKEAWYKLGTQGNFSDILSQLDFSTPRTAPTKKGELQAWWQETDNYSLAFAGEQKPVTVTQLLPDQEGLQIPNKLRAFAARPGHTK